jgi:hypothetical protein
MGGVQGVQGVLEFKEEELGARSQNPGASRRGVQRRQGRSANLVECSVRSGPGRSRIAAVSDYCLTDY